MKAALLVLVLGGAVAYGQDAGMMAAQQAMQAAQMANQQAMQDAQMANQQAMQFAQQASQDAQQAAQNASLYSGPSVAIARQPTFSADPFQAVYAITRHGPTNWDIEVTTGPTTSPLQREDALRLEDND